MPTTWYAPEPDFSQLEEVVRALAAEQRISLDQGSTTGGIDFFLKRFINEVVRPTTHHYEQSVLHAEPLLAIMAALGKRPRLSDAALRVLEAMRLAVLRCGQYFSVHPIASGWKLQVNSGSFDDELTQFDKAAVAFLVREFAALRVELTPEDAEEMLRDLSMATTYRNRPVATDPSSNRWRAWLRLWENDTAVLGIMGLLRAYDPKLRITPTIYSSAADS